jgi:hypothetical protein
MQPRPHLHSRTSTQYTHAVTYPGFQTIEAAALSCAIRIVGSRRRDTRGRYIYLPTRRCGHLHFMPEDLSFPLLPNPLAPTPPSIVARHTASASPPNTSNTRSSHTADRRQLDSACLSETVRNPGARAPCPAIRTCLRPLACSLAYTTCCICMRVLLRTNAHAASGM